MLWLYGKSMIEHHAFYRNLLIKEITSLGGASQTCQLHPTFLLRIVWLRRKNCVKKKKANQLKIVFASFRGHLAGYGGCYSLGIDGSGLCILIGALLLYTFVMSGAVLWTSCVNALSK